MFSRAPWTVTNQGLEIKLGAGSALVAENNRWSMVLMPLNCVLQPRSQPQQPCLLLLAQVPQCIHYSKLACGTPDHVVPKALGWSLAYRDCGDETLYSHDRGTCLDMWDFGRNGRPSEAKDVMADLHQMLRSYKPSSRYEKAVDMMIRRISQ